MGFETSPLNLINRRTFIKSMAVGAASLALPALWTGPEAEARVIQGGVKLTRFAHLTDLHFTNRTQNRYPTSHWHIKQAVKDLNEQDLDFVMFTGDMFHFPEDMRDEMPLLKDALKDLKHPYYCAIGNHDAEGAGVTARKTFLKANMGDQGLAMGDNYYTFSPADGIHFVVLDSTDIDGDDYHAWSGHMGDRQMRWLKETLTRLKQETVFIAIHHPPITPYPFMDKLKFESAAKAQLEQMLNEFPNVQLMLAGHYHFGGRNRFAGTELLLGPSLVEHPHPYRIIDVHRVQNGVGALAYQWKSLNLHGDEDNACAHGTAGVRSFGLMRMSYQHNGLLPLALPG